MNNETDEEVEAFVMGTEAVLSRPPEEKRQLKPGYKTTEFWFSAIVGALPWVLSTIPPTWQIVVSAGAGAVYSLARGLAKLGIGR